MLNVIAPMNDSREKGNAQLPAERLREDRWRHLEFVQNVISRMAGNSFLLKGWSITITSAFFALAAKDSKSVFAVLAFFPAFSFWGLDAYYLRLERLYRKLYDEVRSLPDDILQERVGPFSLRVDAYSSRVDSWFATLFSSSVLWLHLVVVASISILAVVLYRGKA